ncbi:hypothetical protein [Rhizobium mulingense]|uniref:hypothetical protein n=1 Tax=Rhizobium mulingense TaxID=3031128 RepID=UPI002B4823FB|nr:hypothetical protein [Rhizobium sp. MJ21]MEB3047075.1 hypothetical protein [Rhizobium sp. MJ21]
MNIGVSGDEDHSYPEFIVMGNSIGSGSSPMTSASNPAVISHFFSSSARIEGAALDQLDEMSRLPGVSEIAGKEGATMSAIDLLVTSGNDPLECRMALSALLPSSSLTRSGLAAPSRRPVASGRG